MALEGDIKTPLGEVSKKTALIAGGAVVLIGGIVWWRQKQTASTPDASTTSTDGTDLTAEIDPATGYEYGSAEDTAALAAQGGSLSSADQIASTASSDTPVVATNNSQWVQDVLSYMENNGIMSDVSGLSTALGKYVTGAYVTDDDVALIQQAIAVEGQPPVAGANGYPPSLNRTPPSTSTGGTTTTTPASSVSGTLWRRTTANATSISVQAGGITGAALYEIFVNGALWSTVTSTASSFSFTVPNTKPGTKYTIGIQPVSASGKAGKLTNGTVTTPKK